MDEYGPDTYGEFIAAHYDERYPGVQPSMIDRLAEIGGAGPVLELGIGTGRVAIPLADRGVEVHGLDASPPMVEKMKAKPGGGDIPVAIRNMEDLGGLGPFRMVYVVANTFFAMLDQDTQVRAFGSVASVLEPDGSFVMEAFVPDVSRFDRNQRVEVVSIDTDEVAIDVAMYDPRDQTVMASNMVFGPDKQRQFPVKLRFSYPSELDLMARLAGMSLVERWGGWDREPYTGVGIHVSTWRPIGEESR
ncbi:MAG: methyltransferase domain-containing protein [Acidimicrobiia bacterium]|nr:methyltransferase domain-containing protein [Acidimicrobiia bacterium]